MFSHVVIFWTDPENPKSADELLAGMEKFLKPIPGVLQFHAGKMVGSHRPVVDQTYQVALNLIFPNKKRRMNIKPIRCTWSLSKRFLRRHARRLLFTTLSKTIA